MLPKKILLLILVFSINHFYNYGQRINYSNPQSYDPSNEIFTVAGKVGNNLHIWKFHAFTITNRKIKTPISILIFNDQMQLIKETPVKMMDETIYGVAEYFQLEGNICYAYIKYFTPENVAKTQVSKIDENGNMMSINPYVNAPENAIRFYTSKMYHYVKADSNVYYATTKSMISDSNQVNRLEASNGASVGDQNLFIYKKDLTFKHPLLHARYSSAIFNFSDCRIALGKDNTIWVCASYTPDSEKKHIDQSMPSLFLVRLDSNLHEISVKEKFTKLNSPDLANDIFFRIENAFAINKNLFLLTLGNHLTTFYTNYTTFKAYEIKSLRILQIDESNKCAMDTIINTNLYKAKLSTQNSFYSSNANRIDLLYQQQFSNNLNGILHISISDNTVRQNDIAVNPSYNYILPEATKLDETTYIIPFTHHRKIGFMKWVDTSQAD